MVSVAVVVRVAASVASLPSWRALDSACFGIAAVLRMPGEEFDYVWNDRYALIPGSVETAEIEAIVSLT